MQKFPTLSFSNKKITSNGGNRETRAKPSSESDSQNGRTVRWTATSST